jgi:hypothetical protein
MIPAQTNSPKAKSIACIMFGPFTEKKSETCSTGNTRFELEDFHRQLARWRFTGRSNQQMGPSQWNTRSEENVDMVLPLLPKRSNNTGNLH